MESATVRTWRREDSKLVRRLLSLLGPDGSQLLLPAGLARSLAGLGVQEVVPPAEAGGVVANELLVVHIVVVGAGPDGQEVSQTPGEVVARVGVDGLEQTQDDPHVHGEQVEVTGEGDPEDWAADGADGEEHDLNRGGVLGGEAEGRGVGVVQLVDVLVERAVVQGTVEPVVPSVLHDEEDCDLVGHLEDAGERDAVVHAEVGSNWVEEPDLGELDGDVGQEDQGGAVELLLPCR